MATKVSELRIVRALLLILAAVGTGLLLPLTVVAFIVAAAFLAAGNSVPSLDAFSLVPASFVILMIAIAGLGIAIIASNVLRSCAPIGLGIVALAGALVGCVLSVMAFSTAEEYALEMFSDRSTGLVRAIEDYQRIVGHPPKQLTELIPRFLTEIPSTGLTGYPEFHYTADAGPCSVRNSWHLTIPVPEFDVRYLVFCPMQDYDALDLDEQFRMKRFGAWVRTSM